MTFDFSNQAVLITGAGAGIGAAAAEAFAAAGARVAVNSAGTSGEAVARALTEKGRPAVFVRGDVSQAEDAQRIVEETVAAFGRLDVVVHAAGIVAGGNVEETDLESWRRTMDVNVGGVFLVSKFAAPHLRASKGVIVTVSSLVAVKGIANRAAYSASKGAVLSLSRAMAADYLKEGVRVNCVSPGTILTPSLKDRIAQSPEPEQAMKDFVARQPMGRLGEAGEVATAILFAASREAGFLDGANIQIDGGASM